MFRRAGILVALALAAGALAAPRDPVTFAVTLEQMRGHYDAMLLNYKNGDLAMARRHAAHPTGELYATVKGDLTPAQQRRFQADYKRIDAVLAASKPAAELQTALNTFFADVDGVLAALPGRNDPKFAAQVAGGVLGNTATEYGSGVKNGKVADLAEYQDAQTYLNRAQGWLDRFEGKFPADQGGEARKYARQAKVLFLNKADKDQVSDVLRRARVELAEISGVALKDASTGAYFDKIEDLLVQAKGHYASGMAGNADESLVSAYLDNFEYLEGPLAAKDRALELKLEKTLRETLRALVKNKAGSAQFAAAVDAARADLTKARALLE